MSKPSDSWGGQGLLGVSIRFCSFEGSNEIVWHVLEVHPNSPALIAGLQPFTDYIVGADSVLHESEDLYTLVESHEGRSLKLYVYNCEDDSCREVTIIPNRSWGGEGFLGCGIGYGYLHRIPVRGTNPPTTTITHTHTHSGMNPPIIHPEEPVEKKESIDVPSSNIIEPKADETVAEVKNESIDVPNVNPVPTMPSQLPVVPNENPFRHKSSNFTSHIPPPSSIPQFINVENMANMPPPPAMVGGTFLPPPITIPQFTNVGMPLNTNEGQQAVPMYTVNYSQSNPTINSFSQNPFMQPSVLPMSVPQPMSIPSPVVDTENTNVNSNVLQQPPFFNPEIAAQSAQQLLQSNPNFRIS